MSNTKLLTRHEQQQAMQSEQASSGTYVPPSMTPARAPAFTLEIAQRFVARIEGAKCFDEKGNFVKTLNSKITVKPGLATNLIESTYSDLKEQVTHALRIQDKQQLERKLKAIKSLIESLSDSDNKPYFGHWTELAVETVSDAAAPAAHPRPEVSLEVATAYMRKLKECFHQEEVDGSVKYTLNKITSRVLTLEQLSLAEVAAIETTYYLLIAQFELAKKGNLYALESMADKIDTLKRGDLHYFVTVNSLARTFKTHPSLNSTWPASPAPAVNAAAQVEKKDVVIQIKEPRLKPDEERTTAGELAMRLARYILILKNKVVKVETTPECLADLKALCPHITDVGAIEFKKDITEEDLGNILCIFQTPTTSPTGRGSRAMTQNRSATGFSKGSSALPKAFSTMLAPANSNLVQLQEFLLVKAYMGLISICYRLNKKPKEEVIVITKCPELSEAALPSEISALAQWFQTQEENRVVPALHERRLTESQTQATAENKSTEHENDENQNDNKPANQTDAKQASSYFDRHPRVLWGLLLGLAGGAIGGGAAIVTKLPAIKAFLLSMVIENGAGAALATAVGVPLAGLSVTSGTGAAIGRASEGCCRTNNADMHRSLNSQGGHGSLPGRVVSSTGVPKELTPTLDTDVGKSDEQDLERAFSPTWSDRPHV